MHRFHHFRVRRVTRTLQFKLKLAADACRTFGKDDDAIRKLRSLFYVVRHEDDCARAFPEHSREFTPQTQALTQRLMEVQETERRHIARELHDEIGQTLTVAEMNLQAALESPAAADQDRRLQESQQAVQRVLEQVQDLSLSLRPSMLDDLGLVPALGVAYRLNSSARTKAYGSIVFSSKSSFSNEP